MHTVTVMLPAQPHTTSKGEVFELALRKKQLPPHHDYWLYFVEAAHKSWRKLGFMVFVTKQAYPSEELADHLARTLAMEEAKTLLEEAGEAGRPLYLPLTHEGWAIH